MDDDPRPRLAAVCTPEFAERAARTAEHLGISLAELIRRSLEREMRQHDPRAAYAGVPAIAGPRPGGPR